MDSKKSLEMNEIFDEIDVDHSDDWSIWEVHLAALRFADSPTDHVKISRFYSFLSNCTGMSIETVVADDETFRPLHRADVLKCKPLLHEMLALTAKRKRFRFRISEPEVSRTVELTSVIQYIHLFVGFRVCQS